MKTIYRTRYYWNNISLSIFHFLTHTCWHYTCTSNNLLHTQSKLNSKQNTQTCWLHELQSRWIHCIICWILNEFYTKIKPIYPERTQLQMIYSTPTSSKKSTTWVVQLSCVTKELQNSWFTFLNHINKMLFCPIFIPVSSKTLWEGDPELSTS